MSLVDDPTVRKAMRDGPPRIATHWDITDKIESMRHVPMLTINGEHEFMTDSVCAPFFTGADRVKWVKFAESSHMRQWEERERYISVVCTFLEQELWDELLRPVLLFLQMLISSAGHPWGWHGRIFFGVRLDDRKRLYSLHKIIPPQKDALRKHGRYSPNLITAAKMRRIAYAKSLHHHLLSDSIRGSTIVNKEHTILRTGLVLGAIGLLAPVK
ncbi:hypothetical protein DFH07DRAFT_936821, partial [Mycena maculata]